MDSHGGTNNPVLERIRFVGPADEPLREYGSFLFGRILGCSKEESATEPTNE